MINREVFYGEIRSHIFNGKLTQSQVEGINADLDFWEKNEDRDLRKLAYVLGTEYHETATTMQPIEEYGKGKGKPYGKKLKYGRGPNKRVPYTQPYKYYYGRGKSQTTWYENYELLTKAAEKEGYDWDFLTQPELLLQMEPSVWAIFYAMRTGLYTGKKLDDYFTAEKADWRNARKIINDLDQADLIANKSKEFYNALLMAHE